MREALFVKQNREKWQRFEAIDPTDADALAERFVEITNDLAYAKTFYPDSKTTVYLNGLATRLHQSVYTNKKEKANRFISFWKTELPLLFYVHRKKFRYSLIFFVLFYLMGMLSAKYDDSFVRLILGDSYVNTTIQNIEKGDPFGVYKSNAWAMFAYIFMNNAFVSLMMFALGLFFSLGSMFMMLRNGIMIGSFQYFFIERGLGTEFILTVFIHGTLEISELILAGGAGLILGNSILFPKTYSRMESLKRGAKDGVKVILGLIPIVLAAAILESFVTRYTEMPTALSVAILALSAIFIIWYVILYPRKLNKLTVDAKEGRI